MTVRLNKLLAQRGLGARRKCDALIQQGQVRVNGDVVREPGTQVDPDRDRIVVGGRALPREAGLRYYVLNKPVGVITTLQDPQGRRTVAEFMPPGARLFPVGRLDADTSGLLMLTNDGELAHHLMHPRYGVDKTYRIHVDRPPTPGQLERLRRGVEFEPGVRSSPAEVKLLEGGDEGALIQLTIHEGRYRQVRRMCEAVGLYVRALHRSGYGPLRLGPLPRGMWRELSDAEVAALRAASARPRERGQHGWASPRRAAHPAARAERGAARVERGAPRAERGAGRVEPGAAAPRRPSTPEQAFAARAEAFERTGRSAPEADWLDEDESAAPEAPSPGGRRARARAARQRTGPVLSEATEREARRRFGVPARAPRQGGAAARAPERQEVAPPPRSAPRVARGREPAAAPDRRFARPAGRSERVERPRVGRERVERPRVSLDRQGRARPERGSFERPRAGFERPRGSTEGGRGEGGRFQRPIGRPARARPERGAFERPRTGFERPRGGAERARGEGGRFQSPVERPGRARPERGGFARPRTGFARPRGGAERARGEGGRFQRPVERPGRARPERGGFERPARGGGRPSSERGRTEPFRPERGAGRFERPAGRGLGPPRAAGRERGSGTRGRVADRGARGPGRASRAGQGPPRGGRSGPPRAVRNPRGRR